MNLISLVWSITVSTLVPPPNVDVMTNPVVSGELIEGTYIDLVCNASIDEGVNTNIAVAAEWSKDNTPIFSLGGSAYNISEVMELYGNYISTVHIAELEKSVSDGDYKCSVSVIPNVTTHVTGSNGSNEITIAVRGKIK